MLRIKTLALGAVLIAGLAPRALHAANAYIQHNLVADTPGVADLTDPNLVNPWGIAISATSPFWLSDNGSGLATVYSTSSTATLTNTNVRVSIPAGAASSDPKGPVTGQISNSTTVFLLANGTKASFIFCTEAGTISAWNGGTVASNQVDNSSKGAVYKGLALGGTAATPQIYVANFNAGTIEVYDGNFAPVKLPAGAFTDPQILAGFAPFNVQNLGGKLYVTYAKQNAAKHDDDAGPGNGYVDIYDMNGAGLQRLVAGGSSQFSLGRGDCARQFRFLFERLAGGQLWRWPHQCLRCNYGGFARRAPGFKGKHTQDFWAMGFAGGQWKERW